MAWGRESSHPAVAYSPWEGMVLLFWEVFQPKLGSHQRGFLEQSLGLCAALGTHSPQQPEAPPHPPHPP